MKKLVDFLEEEMKAAFEKAGYDPNFAKVTVSNRPDLCEYQCNGAMAAAKTYHKAPMIIAGDVAVHLEGSEALEDVQAVNPGFINMKVKKEFLGSYTQEMREANQLGVEHDSQKRCIILDYGGANVAKPLHVGHLRSAIIGECLKRILRFKGHEVIGDVHLGDWGYQMGLVITELRKRNPELVYFDEQYEGEYPEEAPFTINDLEEIYPYASAYAKEHEDYKEEALAATFELQNGRKGYRALWKHIMRVSIADLKRNYENLTVTFDLWKGEADAQPYILKSDGAALYDTTDLATLVEREKLYHPDEVIYMTDKRQELHFVQVFRCAKKTGIVPEDTKLTFIGFGTMNGKDGKPFKTRAGGVMRLSDLIHGINEEMYKKIAENRTVAPEEAEKTAQMVGLAALKYGDLSNQAAKDYVFDLDKFASFEGNTGPYILYTIVRIKSILNKYKENGGDMAECRISEPHSESERGLMLEAAKFTAVMEQAYEELAPHKICGYIFDLANSFNRFYHENRILGEEDKEKQQGYLALLDLVKDILMTSIGLLGFEAPERM